MSDLFETRDRRAPAGTGRIALSGRCAALGSGDAAGGTRLSFSALLLLRK